LDQTRDHSGATIPQTIGHSWVIAYDKKKQTHSRRVPGKMKERNNPAGSGRDLAYQEVVRILKLKSRGRAAPR
jgi:hypothetical protein